jgi:hypothetical protein
VEKPKAAAKKTTKKPAKKPAKKAAKRKAKKTAKKKPAKKNPLYKKDEKPTIEDTLKQFRDESSTDTQ